MAAVNQKDSHCASTMPFYTLMNFSSTVLRLDERKLLDAMVEYQQALEQEQRLSWKAA